MMSIIVLVVEGSLEAYIVEQNIIKSKLFEHFEIWGGLGPNPLFWRFEQNIWAD